MTFDCLKIINECRNMILMTAGTGTCYIQGVSSRQTDSFIMSFWEIS